MAIGARTLTAVCGDSGTGTSTKSTLSNGNLDLIAEQTAADRYAADEDGGDSRRRRRYV